MMRRVRVVLAVALSLLASCASRRVAEVHIERADTFRAVLAERLSVSLDDVIIIPPDSVRPMVVARRAEIRRVAAAEVSSAAHEQVSELRETTTEAPRVEAPPLWPLLLLLAAAVFIRWFLNR